MANYGVAPKEEILVPNGINDLQIQTQKDAFEWWEKRRSKKSLRGKYRGLTVTQIYVKVVLKK